MSWIKRNLRETITVWTVASTDVYDKPTYTRSTVKGRWEDKQVKTIDVNGKEIVSYALVFVDTDVIIGSYLYQGTSTATSPVSGSREVANFAKIPSIKGTQYERKAILK